jgi:hypothetical protein
MKAFFSLFPFLLLLNDWLPWGLWQLAVFTSGKTHPIYSVFHQLWLHRVALVSGDCCHTLHSPPSGLICWLTPNAFYTPVH